MRRSITFIFLSFFFLNYSLAQAPCEGYELKWEDNFDGLELDSSKWTYRYLGKRRDAYNAKHTVTVQNGYLALRSEIKNDSVFTAMISTKGNYATTFGYFEIKCKLQQEQGHWSAFWLQSPILGKYIGDPARSGAEIDVFEFLPKNPKQIHQTLHYDGYKEYHKVKHKIIKNRKFDPSNWHTFGVEWTPTHYTYYIDGKATFTVKEGVSEIKQYLIISLEVGDWAGDIQKAKLPDYLIVDYVKVYKKKKPF